MIRTMAQLWSVNPGFDPRQVVTFGIAGSPAVHGTPEAVRHGFVRTTDRLRAVSGVTAASVLVGGLPMDGDSELPYWVEGRPKPSEQSQMDMALFYAVDPEYLTVMRIPLLRGRFLTSQDTYKTPCVVAIDEDFVARAFPGQEALGQHINLEFLNAKCEVVGVVGHVKHWGLDADATAKVRSQMYLAFHQLPDSVMDLASTGSEYVVRTSTDPSALVPALKRAVTEVSGNMVMFGEQTMQDVINDSLSARRFTRLLLGTFVALALVLIGLILIQHGKGADMGAAFGSGSSGSLFGASGSANFLSRTTAVLAALFFVATLALAYFGNARPASSGSVLENPAAAVPAGAPSLSASDAAVAPVVPASGAAQIPTK